MTLEKFWRENHGESATWRRARKAHTCSQCGEQISAKSRYFDTGEQTGGPYVTAKLCEVCATVSLEEAKARFKVWRERLATRS